jgi:putative colanic acid biosynthesis acetyltransferase WcaF
LAFTHSQKNRFASPWSLKIRLKRLLWSTIENSLFRWSPKPFNRWRLFLLSMFGCKISGLPFVANTCRIYMPWNVELMDRCCIGDKANLYSLGHITIEERVTVAQECYLCTGTHDFASPTLELVTNKIVIKKDSFLGFRVSVLPGTIVESNCIIGACTTVSKNVERNTMLVAAQNRTFVRPRT